MNAPHTHYLIASDFHLTSGKDPTTGRWSATEDFFDDEAFDAFLAHYEEHGNCTLVLNGDLCDFMQVLVLPTEDEMQKYGITASEVDSAYGLRSSEACNAFQMDCIIRGHRVMFRALGRFLAKGNRIVILKGNHDIQLYWPGVQQRIRTALAKECSAFGAVFLDNQLEFPQWFYLVPGVLYVEHGNQFENTTAFRNFLYPLLPASEGNKPQLELDLSSFLVRYLTNKFEPVNPLADNIRPLSQYYETIWKKHPWLAIDTAGTAFKYLLKAFGKARHFARAKGRLKDAYDAIEAENRRRITEEAQRYAAQEQGQKAEAEAHRMNTYWTDNPDAAGRPVPTLERGAWRFAWSITWTALKKLVWVLPVYLFTMVPEIGALIVDGIRSLQVGWLTAAFEWLHKFNIVQWIVLAIVVVIIFGIRKSWLHRRTEAQRKKNLYSDPVMPDVSLYMRDKAEHIARAFNVPTVTFGHTHYPDTTPLGNGGRYFNTGTWMGIFQPEENLYRDVQQYTFLHVDGTEARLLKWNPESNRPEPIVVIDTETPFTDVEDNVVTIIRDTFSK